MDEPQSRPRIDLHTSTEAERREHWNRLVDSEHQSIHDAVRLAVPINNTPPAWLAKVSKRHHELGWI